MLIISKQKEGSSKLPSLNAECETLHNEWDAALQNLDTTYQDLNKNQEILGKRFYQAAEAVGTVGELLDEEIDEEVNDDET